MVADPELSFSAHPPQNLSLQEKYLAVYLFQVSNNIWGHQQDSPGWALAAHVQSPAKSPSQMYLSMGHLLVAPYLPELP